MPERLKAILDKITAWWKNLTVKPVTISSKQSEKSKR